MTKAYLLRASMEGTGWAQADEEDILKLALPGDTVIYPGTVLDAKLEIKVRKEEIEDETAGQMPEKGK